MTSEERDQNFGGLILGKSPWLQGVLGSFEPLGYLSDEASWLGKVSSNQSSILASSRYLPVGTYLYSVLRTPYQVFPRSRSLFVTIVTSPSRLV